MKRTVRRFCCEQQREKGCWRPHKRTQDATQTSEHLMLCTSIHSWKPPTVYRIIITFNSYSFLAAAIITRNVAQPGDPRPLPPSFAAFSLRFIYLSLTREYVSTMKSLFPLHPLFSILLQFAFAISLFSHLSCKDFYALLSLRRSNFPERRHQFALKVSAFIITF